MQKIIAFADAVASGMTATQAEVMADWHEEHAENRDVTVKAKLRHEVTAFRFRKLAQALRVRRVVRKAA